MRNPRSILITGASSGIGAALASHYARKGAAPGAAPGAAYGAGPAVHLTLTGRNEARLAQVGDACRKAGASADCALVDAIDADRMQGLIEAAERHRPIDLVIANAGISAGTGGSTEPAGQTRRIFETNIDGVANTVLPALDVMMARERAGGRPRGQIAIMSSMAGFRGFPGAPAYCASKAAVRVWGEGLRGMAHHRDVEISVICPGYVRSAMTAGNRFRMPFLMDADRAARIIARRLEKNAGRIVFPWRLYALLRTLNALPLAVTEPLLGRLPAKDTE